MMHLSSVLSSVININHHSPISSSSQLPQLKPQQQHNTANSTNNNNNNNNNIAIDNNNAVNFYKMPSPTSKMDSYHHAHTTAAGYYRQTGADSAAEVLKQQWTQQSSKSNSSISYRTKSLSSSASTSSGCSSDSEQGLNLHDDEHNHHDTAPDSPDSGVSGSISGGDDLKSTDFEDDHEGSHTDNYKRSFEMMDYDDMYHNVNASFNSSHKDQHKVRKNSEVDSTFPTVQALDPLSIINHLTATSKNNVTKSFIKPQYSCRWFNCDWPGSYEELADHLREIHVELQPYLDSNGKVIKQWSKRKNHTKLRKDVNLEDDVSSNSESDDDDTQEDEDDELGSDDDSQSIDSASTCRVTRRSNQNQGLLDYSHYNNSVVALRPRRCDRSFGDQVGNVDKGKLSQQQFVCLWRGCKVYGKPSSSRLWLERHILEQHSGPKPFKCIVDTCGLRFKSQASLNRHVNTHFRADQQNNSQSSGTISTSTNQSNGSSGNCCCSCCCHSCMICDNSSCHPEPAPLSDKTRSASTDSGISLNSSSFEECLPSSSSFTTSSSSTSHESLSKLANSTTSELLQSQYHQNGFCHAKFCCSIQTEKQIAANATRLSNLISKTKHWNRKNLISANRPIVRSISNLDFLDAHFSQKLSHKVTTRDRFMANLSPLEATIKSLSIRANKLNVAEQLSTESVSSECIVDDNDDDCKEDSSTNHKPNKNSDLQKIQIVNPKLFKIPEENYFKFVSEVTACHVSLEGKSRLRLHWHPVGILEDVWIPKDELESHRSKLVPYCELPEEFRLQLIEFPFVGRKLRNVSSSTNSRSSSSSSSSSLSAQPPSNINNKSKSLSTTTTTTKRSHSPMSETKSTTSNSNNQQLTRTSKKQRNY